MTRQCIVLSLLAMLALPGEVHAEDDTFQCEATLTEIQKNRYLEKKQLFLEFVDECSEKLLSMHSIIVSESFFKEWEQHFRQTQMSWLEQLEKDSKNLLYSNQALGGSHHDRDSFVYSAHQIDERIEETLSQLSCLFGRDWWRKEDDSLIASRK